MAYDLLGNVAFVDADGSYSGGTEILIFDGFALNDEQWDTLGTLPDYEKMSYARAILDGESDLSKWED
jgi:hypothetical protein